MCSFFLQSKFGNVVENNTNKYGFSYIINDRLLANDILERENRPSSTNSNTSHNRTHRNVNRAEISYSESENTIKSKQYNKDVYNSLREKLEKSDYSSSNHKKKRSLIKKIDYHFEQKIFKALDSIMQSKRSSKSDQYSFISFKNKKLRKITIPGTVTLVIGLACMIAGRVATSNTAGPDQISLEFACGESPSTVHENFIQCKNPKLILKNYGNVSEYDNFTGFIFYTTAITLLIMGLLIMIYISLKIYKYMEIQELKTSPSSKKH
ncbi:Protein of unknown function, putative [Plasmodium vivax]|uniref:Uncharacterized protein n=1 Tax=Plasmodium vivax TaxID=5855 RepID=A0A1G4E4Q5_PLAVI|nr:Protein of unknown function, putative [Plasmodium vivax]